MLMLFDKYAFITITGSTTIRVGLLVPKVSSAP